MKLRKNLKLFAGIALLFGLTDCHREPARMLPIFGEKKVLNTGDTAYHSISDFTLTNQYGELVSQKNMENKICVSNFFFATCQSICPEMSTNLTAVQREFAKDTSVLILSHSVNPLHDTVEVLKNYAITYGALKNKWHLLTGHKQMIYDLAKFSYLVNAIEDDGTPEGFLHSELLLLVDTHGRIRGMYDGTDKAEVQKLISDIHLLEKEN